MQEKELEDGRKELVLVERDGPADSTPEADDDGSGNGIVNVVGTKAKSDLMKRRTQTPKADKYTDWLEKSGKESTKDHGHMDENGDEGREGVGNGETVLENRAQYKEPPFLPSEKRRIYFGPETPVLAPLTTQGNLPFRRLCIGL
jgi:tRNA-dihydrouridine synthase 3